MGISLMMSFSYLPKAVRVQVLGRFVEKGWGIHCTRRQKNEDEDDDNDDDR